MTTATTVITPRPLASRPRRLALSAVGAALVCCVLFVVGLPLVDTVTLVGLAAGAALVVVLASFAWPPHGSVRGLLVLTALVFAPVSRVAPAREIGILFGTLLGGGLLAEEGLERRLLASLCMVLGIVALAVG